VAEMPLEDIYIHEIDRATSRLETVRINKDRQFIMVPLGEDGRWTGSPALYHWQNGEWYDTGGNPLDPSQVPEKFRKEIEDNPVRVATVGSPIVTETCKYCGWKGNTSEYGDHVLQHADEFLKQAGKIEQKPENPKDRPEKNDANRLRG